MLSWICAGGTLVSIYYGGNHKLIGPVFGIAGVLPWTLMAIQTRQWGMIPLNIIIAFLQARALHLWRRDGATWI